MSTVTFKDIKENEQIQALIDGANRTLSAIGYTEHGVRHCGYVSKCSAMIMQSLDYPARNVELTAITGWVHDVGNLINRHNHGISGANLLYPVLLNAGMDIAEITDILAAVGNHEEQYGKAISPMCSALIIADKSDTHRTRVRKGTYDPNSIHERVNYSIRHNEVKVDKEHARIRYEITMDESSSCLDFLQIYLSRMILCEQAARFLGCSFELIINGTLINNKLYYPPDPDA